MTAKLMSLTQPTFEVDGKKLTPEQLMVYTARVSSPQNQQNVGSVGLLRYCLEHGHWSVFEMVDMTLELETSRAIAAQLLRHKSFSFQEFSQRYAKSEMHFFDAKARSQDLENKQASHDDLPEDVKNWFELAHRELIKFSYQLYEKALEKNIAKESARFLLPLSIMTRIYAKNSVRGWIHYIQARTYEGAQKEHRDLAEACKEIFVKQFPVIAEALNWTNEPNSRPRSRVVHSQTKRESAGAGKTHPRARKSIKIEGKKG